MAEATVDGIKINTIALRTAASRMEAFSGQMYDVLMAAKKKISDMQTNAVWISPAGQVIIDQINKVQPRIEDQKALVAKFVKFLNKTAEYYEMKEEQRQNDAINVPTAPPVAAF